MFPGLDGVGLIDTGQLPSITSNDQAELVAARRRIAELETELAIHPERSCRASYREATGMRVVQLLVVGSSRHGAPTRTVRGLVTRAMVDLAGCPVATVPLP